MKTIEKMRKDFDKFGAIYTLPKESYMMSVFGITRPSGFRMDAKYDTENIWKFIESLITQDRKERDEEVRIKYHGRVSDFLGQKNEGIPRIHPFYENAILSILSSEIDDSPKDNCILSNRDNKKRGI